MVQRLVFLSIEKLHYLLHLASISDCHVGQLNARHLVKEYQNAIQKLKIATHPLFLILGISSPKLQPPTNNLPSSFSSIGIYITCTLKGYSSNECHFKSINWPISIPKTTCSNAQHARGVRTTDVSISFLQAAGNLVPKIQFQIHT